MASISHSLRNALKNMEQRGNWNMAHSYDQHQLESMPYHRHFFNDDSAGPSNRGETNHSQLIQNGCTGPC